MTTREAAIKWSQSIKGGEFYSIATELGYSDLFHISESEIENIWMHEVVLPHYSGFVKFDQQDHQTLGELYLKEHEVKEEGGVQYDESNHTGKYKAQKIGREEQPEVSLPVSEVLERYEKQFSTTFKVGDEKILRPFPKPKEAFMDGAKWQKEQDKELIQSLLDALISETDSALGRDGAEPFEETLTVIDKATEYLKS